jgi:translation initiation factor IF-1
MSQQEILDKLKSDFTYMFSSPGYFTYQLGWNEIFDQLCRQIDALLPIDKRGFRWTQIKEKYGSARFYFELDGRRETIVDLHLGGKVVSMRVRNVEDDDVRIQIVKLIAAAQSESERTCVICGKDAQIRLVDRWLCCLCDAHIDASREEIRQSQLE